MDVTNATTIIYNAYAPDTAVMTEEKPLFLHKRHIHYRYKIIKTIYIYFANLY